MPKRNEHPDTPFIVGIGASAGGLEAISTLLKNLEADLPCAYVILQHSSPTHRSMLVDILTRETLLPVHPASHNLPLQSGNIYVVSADKDARLHGNQFVLESSPPETLPKPSINQFFISLASEHNEHAIGIVLSGTGSDGCTGLHTIQTAGGLSIVQTPETAKYSGMPEAAIENGAADLISPPDKIPAQLKKWITHSTQDFNDIENTPVLQQLLQTIKSRLTYDFSGYKTATLFRRIKRREIACNCHNLKDYHEYITQHPEEIHYLCQDLLISVTAFFRDQQAFDRIHAAIHRLCQQKQHGAYEIRIWVAGCASGEEAYSLAILLADELGDKRKQYRIQIFATDIDEAALNIARTGIYPAASVAQVPPRLLEKHFKPIRDNYEVSKTLRDMVLFAKHNLVSDPPFLRLDLISCRNVLIYFDSSLQQKVLSTFHFGLQNDGYLFLGRSESITQAEHLFNSVDRRQRLFSKHTHLQTPHITSAKSATKYTPRQPANHLLLLNQISQYFHAAVVLCDDNDNIIQTTGDITPYIEFPKGEVQLKISDIIHNKLHGELLTLIHHGKKSNQPQTGRPRRINANTQPVRLSLIPVRQKEKVLLIIFFETHWQQNDLPTLSDSSKAEMESELKITQEQLQTLIEELETTNEEMQTLNEETQASNEELQATNEELEASNEELQATNQELLSVNEELQLKSTELSELSEEYIQLYDSLDFAVMVLNPALKIKRYNQQASRLFDLYQTSIGLSIEQLNHADDLVRLPLLLQQCLTDKKSHGETLLFRNRSLRLQITPTLSPKGIINSLIMSLIDIDDMVRTRDALNASQQRLETLITHTSILFAMKDIQGNYQFMNPRFCELFAITSKNKGNHFSLLPNQIADDMWSNDLKGYTRKASYQLRVSLSAKWANLSSTSLPPGGFQYTGCSHQPGF